MYRSENITRLADQYLARLMIERCAENIAAHTPNLRGYHIDSPKYFQNLDGSGLNSRQCDADLLSTPHMSKLNRHQKFLSHIVPNSCSSGMQLPASPLQQLPSSAPSLVRVSRGSSTEDGLRASSNQPRFIRRPYNYKRRVGNGGSSSDGRQGSSRIQKAQKSFPRTSYPGEIPRETCFDEQVQINQIQPLSFLSHAWSESGYSAAPMDEELPYTTDTPETARYRQLRASYYQQQKTSPCDQSLCHFGSSMDHEYHRDTATSGLSALVMSPKDHYLEQQRQQSDSDSHSEKYCILPCYQLGCAKSQDGEFSAHFPPPRDGCIFGSPHPHEAGHHASWEAEKTCRQKASLLTPVSDCKFPLDGSSKGTNRTANEEGSTQSKPSGIDDAKSPKDSWSHTGLSSEMPNSLDVADDTKLAPQQLDHCGCMDPHYQQTSDLDCCGRKLDLLEIDFDLSQYGISVIQAASLKRIFDKQIELLYRAVADDFNAKFKSTQIGIEFVLGYLQDMPPDKLDLSS